VRAAACTGGSHRWSACKPVPVCRIRQNLPTSDHLQCLHAGGRTKLDVPVHPGASGPAPLFCAWMLQCCACRRRHFVLTAGLLVLPAGWSRWSLLRNACRSILPEPVQRWVLLCGGWPCWTLAVLMHVGLHSIAHCMLLLVAAKQGMESASKVSASARMDGLARTAHTAPLTRLGKQASMFVGPLPARGSLTAHVMPCLYAWCSACMFAAQGLLCL
jgi:hypothetical protein